MTRKNHVSLVYGFRASRALFDRKNAAITKVFLTQSRVKEFSDLLKWCASKRIPYNICPGEQLEKIAKSKHHEGILIEFEVRQMNDDPSFLDISPSQTPVVVAMDGVQNANNLGAMARVFAHFGISHGFAEKRTLPRLPPSYFRVAEGGAEYFQLHLVDDLKEHLLMLKKKGFSLVGTSRRAKSSLYEAQIKKPAVLVFGSESTGLSKNISELLDQVLTIPSSQYPGSLSVTTSAAVVVSEVCRQTGALKT